MVKGKWTLVEEITVKEGQEFRHYEYDGSNESPEILRTLKAYVNEYGPVTYTEVIDGDPTFDLIVSHEWETIKDPKLWNDLTERSYEMAFPELLREEDVAWMGMFKREGRYCRLYVDVRLNRAWIWMFDEEPSTFHVEDVEGLAYDDQGYVGTVKIDQECVVLIEEIEKWCEHEYGMDLIEFDVMTVETIQGSTVLTFTFRSPAPIESVQKKDAERLILAAERIHEIEQAEWMVADGKIGNGRP